MPHVASLLGVFVGMLLCVVPAARAAPPADVDWPRVSMPLSLVHRIAAVGTVEDGSGTTERFDLTFERAVSVAAPAAGDAAPAIDLTQGRTWGTFTSATPDGERFRRIYESPAELTDGGFGYLSRGRPGVRRRWSEVAPKLLGKPAEGDSAGDLEDLTTIVLVPPERSTPVRVGTDWTTSPVGVGTSAMFRHVVSAIDADTISIRTSLVRPAPDATFALVRRISRRDGLIIDGTLTMSADEGPKGGKVTATEQATRVAAVPRPVPIVGVSPSVGWDSDDPTIRVKAATSVATTWPIDVPTALLLTYALEDDDARVREAASGSLRRLVDRALLSAVKSIAGLPKDMRRDAGPGHVETARLLGDHLTYVDLSMAVRDGSPVALLAASLLAASSDLGRDADDIGRLALLDGLGAPDWAEGMTLTDAEVVEAGSAAIVLAVAGRLPPSAERDAPPSLVALVSDRRPHVRWLAVRLLERAGSTKRIVLDTLRSARSAPVDDWSVRSRLAQAREHDAAAAIEDVVDAALARLKGRAFAALDGAPIELPPAGVEALVVTALAKKYPDAATSRALRAGADSQRLASFVIGDIETSLRLSARYNEPIYKYPDQVDLVGRLGKSGRPAIAALSMTATAKVAPSEKWRAAEVRVAAAAAAIRVGGDAAPMIEVIAKALEGNWSDFEARESVHSIAMRVETIVGQLDEKSKTRLAGAITGAFPSYRPHGTMDAVRLLLRLGVWTAGAVTAAVSEIAPSNAAAAKFEAAPFLIAGRGADRLRAFGREYVSVWASRLEIVEALARLGSVAAPALEVLRTYRDAADPVMRALVRRALRRIAAK